MTITASGLGFKNFVIGAVLGGAVGSIVAVNITINFGPDQGYESSITDIFEHNTVVGIATVVALAAGPVFGVAIARHLRLQEGGEKQP